MDKSTAYMITDMLKGVITHGSGTKARIGDLIQAGKTGTVKYSDEEFKMHPSYRGTPKDSWFVGYTRSYVMSVWTGYDNLNDGKIFGSGEDSAVLYYKAMMSYLMEDKANIDWIKPNTVLVRRYNTENELFQEGHAPAAISAVTRKRINRIPKYDIRRYQRTPDYNINQETNQQSNQRQNTPNTRQQQNNSPVEYYYYNSR
jgi:penicillin-binding protein 1A